MKDLVEFDLEGGGSVLVEVDEPEATAGLVRAARVDGAIAEKAKETFEDALNKLRPAVGSLLEKLRGLPQKPGEVEVEFGVKLNAVAGVILASAATEANFKVTLKWKGSS